MKSYVWIFGLVGMLGALALAACGGDDAPNCSNTTKKMCEKACACTGGGKCSLGGTGASLTFDNQAACEGLFALGCAQTSTQTPNWASCSAALDSAMCVMGADAKSLEYPASCN